MKRCALPKNYYTHPPLLLLELLRFVNFHIIFYGPFLQDTEKMYTWKLHLYREPTRKESWAVHSNHFPSFLFSCMRTTSLPFFFRAWESFPFLSYILQRRQFVNFQTWLLVTRSDRKATTIDLSEQLRSLSWSRNDVPCEMRASLSISPNLTPPPFFLPFTGW